MGIRLLVLSAGRRGEVVEALGRSPRLVVPVHAGIAEVTIGTTRQLVDKASWLLVPGGTRAKLRAKSPVTHILVLSISAPLREAVASAYAEEMNVASFDRYVSDVELMPRTNWVNELCHRYLFERAACKKRDNVATAFLESEIVKELYFLCHERYARTERASVVETRSNTMQRAVAFVEAHLFEANVVQRLPSGCGASASTLLRTFRRELGQGPLAYVRARRLDESLLLLKSKRFAVGEVATMVGYRNFAAFSQAFRARFNVRPSEVFGSDKDTPRT